MEERLIIVVKSRPDPVIQERLEDMGFFPDKTAGARWCRFCSLEEAAGLAEWLKRHRLGHKIAKATGRGEVKKYPRLSESLVLGDGGGPTRCALCGAQNTSCRKWVEGDDTDSTDYPAPAKFYLCGRCVQERMQPHPRLYAPAEDTL